MKTNLITLHDFTTAYLVPENDEDTALLSLVRAKERPASNISTASIQFADDGKPVPCIAITFPAQPSPNLPVS